MLHRATCGQPKTAGKCHAYSNVQLHDPCTVLPNPGALRRHEVTLMAPVSLTCLCSAALRMPSAPTRELRRLPSRGAKGSIPRSTGHHAQPVASVLQVTR